MILKSVHTKVKRFYSLLTSLMTFLVVSFYGSAQNDSNPNSAPVAPVIMKASIDTATITMGERTVMRVEVVKNGHVGTILLPVDKKDEDKGAYTTMGGIEVRQVTVDSADLGNNRIQVNYNILLQPFEPADFTIPPFKYALDGDTLTSNVVALKVIEPEIPQEMRDSLYINPFRPPMSVKAEWYDWVPDWFTDYWYWWLAAFILIAAAVTVFILYRKYGKTLLPSKKVIPPYELATRRLEELKKKRLHERGHNKAYFTELTDILRQYLGGRFKIYALEMTSTQILEAMRENPETSKYVNELKPMFTIADFVKFAKQDSTVDENIRSFNAVENFVHDTRPIETNENEKLKGKEK